MKPYSPSIFISGDSWGCGEWPPPKHRKIINKNATLEHRGLEQYFIEDDFLVYNSSAAGASNNDSIQSLKYNLEKHFQSGDIVLWVQTDPIRDLRPYTDLTNQIKKENGVFALANRVLIDNYSRLNDLAIKFNTNVHLIGGLSSINSTLIGNYNRLITLIVSWPQLLVSHKPEFSQIDYENYGEWGHDWSLDSINLSALMNSGKLPFEIDLAEKIIDELHKLVGYKIIFNDPIFYPDGGHPNREGHKILYDFIKKKLKITAETI